MKFQVFLKAENLPKPSTKGLFRKKPHTFAVVSNVSDFGSVMGIKRHRAGVTEVIPSSASPEWASTFILDYQPDHRVAVDIFHTKEEQMVNYEQHDLRYQGSEHRGIPIPKDAKLITGVIFAVDDVLKSPDGSCTLALPTGSVGATVTAHMEVMREDDVSTIFRFHLRGFAFPNMRRNFLERPDYFFEVYRKQAGQQTHYWALVYRSEPAKGVLSPFWQENDISVAALCNHDLNRELMIRVVDLDALGGRHVLGCFEASPHGIMGAVSTGGNADTTKAFQLMCDAGVKKLGQVIVLQGQVITPGGPADAPMATAVPILADDFVPVEIMQPPPIARAQILPGRTTAPSTVSSSSFQEYARTKCPIDLCMAIDFTNANGDFRSSHSEHYRSTEGLNSYMWTIGVVGETLRHLNPVQEHPMWGFGGSFQGKTYPIFQCGSSPKASGTGGMLNAYRSTFESGLTLGDTRQLDSILAAAANHAKKQLDAARRRKSLSYTLLTVLTVGDDSDVLAAKEKLVSIEGAPLSILFVPIGRSNAMDEQKLQIFLANRNCRRFCGCLDNSVVSMREAPKLSDHIIQILQDQMPAYFHKQGIVP